MVRKLIFANIGVFLLIHTVKLLAYFITADAGNGEVINHWIYMPADPLVFITRPWSLFTYMFVHEGIFHILFNLLWLYILGGIFQEYLGNKKLLKAYIYGGLAGGVLYFIGMNVFPVLRNSAYYPYPLHGASAGVMAVIVGIATLLPNYEIRLLFFNVKLKYIALFMIVASFIEMYGNNPGGNLAHVGGAIVGYLYIRYLSKHTFIDGIEEWVLGIWNRLFNKKDERKIFKTYTTHMRVDNPARPDQDEVDSILDKISKSGYDSLTRTERETLFKASTQDS